MRLAQIASALNARLENGSPDTDITGLNGIEQAGPGELSFVANPKYAAAARQTKASAVIVAERLPGRGHLLDRAATIGPVGVRVAVPSQRSWRAVPSIGARCSGTSSEPLRGARC